MFSIVETSKAVFPLGYDLHGSGIQKIGFEGIITKEWANYEKIPQLKRKEQFYNTHSIFKNSFQQNRSLKCYSIHDTIRIISSLSLLFRLLLKMCASFTPKPQQAREACLTSEDLLL